jgi:hypothetical protein
VSGELIVAQEDLSPSQTLKKGRKSNRNQPTNAEKTTATTTTHERSATSCMGKE